ncbi:DUF914-domain-containing protein [Auriculariales sp. MPI-PUGE-AT-0066]|nr:DUF914-domain-containing protein [Auriculariales sp. MPI-PUGE-AT-0066]
MLNNKTTVTADVLTPEQRAAVRPKIDYSSAGAFFTSTGRRIASIFTRRFMLSLLAGQVVSMCIVATSVATSQLTMRNFNISTTQSLFHYFCINLTYSSYTIYRYGFAGWFKMVKRDGWKYFILAACDVEGNFLVTMSYQYTNLLSCILLDTWAIPACMFFAYLFMRTKYHWTQLLGVFICIVGLGMQVGADELSNGANFPASNMAKGDIFMILGATLYGLTNALEEFFVRKSPLYEVVGQLGFWGFIVSAIQAAAKEHADIPKATWNGTNIGLILAYTAAMFILYTVAPLLYRMSSSTYYNLSLLSSDFFGLLVGLKLYHYYPIWLHFVAFAVIIAGLITYFCHSTPEEQGKIIAQPPEYITGVPRDEEARVDGPSDRDSISKMPLDAEADPDVKINAASGQNQVHI